MIQYVSLQHVCFHMTEVGSSEHANMMFFYFKFFFKHLLAIPNQKCDWKFTVQGNATQCHIKTCYNLFGAENYDKNVH